MSAIPAAPGEERLRLRAAWQGLSGARKSRVLALVGLMAAILMALVYGIATSGRRSPPPTAVATDMATSNGGEWLSQIPDRPRGVTPPPPTPTAPPQTPTTTPPKDTSPVTGTPPSHPS